MEEIAALIDTVLTADRRDSGAVAAAKPRVAAIAARMRDGEASVAPGAGSIA